MNIQTRTDPVAAPASRAGDRRRGRRDRAHAAHSAACWSDARVGCSGCCCRARPAATRSSRAIGRARRDRPPRRLGRLEHVRRQQLRADRAVSRARGRRARSSAIRAAHRPGARPTPSRARPSPAAIASPANGISPAAAGRPTGWARTATWSSPTARCGSTASAGRPCARCCSRPRGDPDPLDTLGMRGTASDGYSVDDVFVPEDFTTTREDPSCAASAGPLYAFTMQGLYAVGVAGVALGIARAMLDEFVALAPQGAARPGASRRQRRGAGRRGAHEARLGSARAYLIDTLTRSVRRPTTSSRSALADRARVRLACTHAIHAAIEVGRLRLQGRRRRRDLPGHARSSAASATSTRCRSRSSRAAPISKRSGTSCSAGCPRCFSRECGEAAVSLDDFVDAREQHRRNFESQRLRGLHIDDQLVFRGLLRSGKSPGFAPLISCRQSIAASKNGFIFRGPAKQVADHDDRTLLEDGGYPAMLAKYQNSGRDATGKWLLRNQTRAGIPAYRVGSTIRPPFSSLANFGRSPYSVRSLVDADWLDGNSIYLTRTRAAMPRIRKIPQIRESASNGSQRVKNIEAFWHSGRAPSGSCPSYFPPGCARLATRPTPTGSLLAPRTIGIVLVAFFGGKPKAHAAITMTSTCARTSSSARPVQELRLSFRRLSLDDDILPLGIAQLLELAHEGHRRHDRCRALQF